MNRIALYGDKGLNMGRKIANGKKSNNKGMEMEISVFSLNSRLLYKQFMEKIRLEKFIKWGM